jgi:hypothetical protein
VVDRWLYAAVCRQRLEMWTILGSSIVTVFEAKFGVIQTVNDER